MKYFLQLIRNEDGLTLIELLAATVIFLLVIIPMSGMYIKGVDTYNQSVNETTLQNELDFLTSNIMNKLQGATYFELNNFDPNDPAYRAAEQAFKLMQYKDPNKNNGQDKNLASEDGLIPANQTFGESPIKPILTTYNIQVKNADQTGQPVSTMTKSVYQFQSDHTNTADKSSYIVFCFFEPDPILPSQKMNLYLLIAPYNAQPPNYKQSGFSGISDIQKYIDNNNPPYEYIRVAKTQISINHNQQG